MCAPPTPRPRRCRSRTQSFDLVTCRIAPHHFDSIPAFLAEVHRVLKPGGLFALVDNVVPPGSVGDYINAFERFRDPSHLRAWTMDEWRDALKAAGLAVGHEEQIGKTMEFGPWAARHDATMQALLHVHAERSDAGGEGGARPAGEGGRRRSPSASPKGCSSRSGARRSAPVILRGSARSRRAPQGDGVMLAYVRRA